MKYGWTGRRLVVDLSSRTWSVEQLPDELLRTYIGGRGLNSRMLYDRVKPGTDPLGPDNVLIFGVGPVNGTLVPGSSRVTVTALSPLTLIGDGAACFGDSNVGGFTGPEIKFAGYDQILFLGQADSPVYLWIDDDRVEIRDAQHLWGLDTSETDKTIRRELGDEEIKTACIGPAGENQARLACIIFNRHRAAGKSGMGGVMGSKKLKAVAVRGTGGVPVARPDELLQVVEEAMETLYEDPSALAWSRYGTPSLLRPHQAHGRLATLNYQRTQFDNWEKLTADALADQYWTATKACFGCPLHCAHWFVVPSGPHASYGEGPEYVCTGGFGSKCGNDDLSAILYCHSLCNKLGLDEQNTGSVLAWAMECWQRRFITEKDTDLKLDWGNTEAMAELIQRIAFRSDDLGTLLAEGAYRAAQAIGQGSEDFLIHVKAQDPALSDGRVAKAWGLAYAVASRGGDHLRALPTGETYFTPEEAEEMFGSAEAVHPAGVKGKGRLVKWSEEQRAAADSLEVCKFIVRTSLMRPEWVARFLNAVTGLDYSGDDMMKIGERIVNLERAFNVRQGLTRKDDALPERFLKEPVPDGPAKGRVMELEPMLDEYYEARGWELKKGYPMRRTLEELDLGDIADELEAMGRLGDLHIATSDKD
jgi:aldehyde:ferredoxin oxidoreductase